MYQCILLNLLSDSGKPVDNEPGFDCICKSTQEKNTKEPDEVLVELLGVSIYKGISKLSCNYNNAFYNFCSIFTFLDENLTLTNVLLKLGQGQLVQIRQTYCYGLVGIKL